MSRLPLGLFLVSCFVACGSVQNEAQLEAPTSQAEAAPQTAPMMPSAPAADDSVAFAVERQFSRQELSPLVAGGRVLADAALRSTALGGWTTNMSAEGSEVRSTGRGTLRVFAHEAGDKQLSVLLRSEASVEVYWNGESVGNCAVAAEPCLLPDRAAVRLGLNALQFRSRKPFAVQGVRWGDAEATEISEWELRFYLPDAGDRQLRLEGSGGFAARISAGGIEREGSGPTTFPLDGAGLVHLRVTGQLPETIVLEKRTPNETASEHRRPRNVLLVLVDTLRADHVPGGQGESRVRAPAFEAFMRDSVAFSAAHSQENWTKPSVTTLLTSIVPWSHGVLSQDARVPEQLTLLPEVLSDQGFHTGALIANGYVSDRFGFAQGWATYRNYIREGRRSMGEFLVADALSWLDERPTDKPFFLYVHAIDPHVPYRRRDEFLGDYGDASYRGPMDFSRDALLLEHIKAGVVRTNEADRSHIRALYAGEIAYFDTQLRVLLDALDSRGLREETLVVLTSDHGEELWDHGSVGHGHSVYEELLHVPLLARVPGRPATRVTSPVGLVDVAPTILATMGLPIPSSMTGRNVLDPTNTRSGIVSGFMEHWRTWTSERYKLVMRGSGELRLYDLANDPTEQVNCLAEHIDAARWAFDELSHSLSETPIVQTRAVVRERIDDETRAQLRALGYVVP